MPILKQKRKIIPWFIACMLISFPYVYEFTDFEVRITDAPYRTSGGLIWPGTVRIVYTDPEKEKTLEEYYGYAPAEMIYQMIREGRDINLSECFIEKFSLTEYRSLQKLEAKSYVKLGAFSARRSFSTAVRALISVLPNSAGILWILKRQCLPAGWYLSTQPVLLTAI